MLGAGCSQLAARAPCFIHQDTNARHRQHTDWNGFRAFSNCDTQGWRVTAVHCDKDSACTAAASRLKLALAAVGAAALVSAASPGLVHATEKVGEFAASGFIFKDTVEVVSVEDSDVPGVQLYISEFKRSLTDKLAKDFFSEPSQASVTCAATGPISVPDLSRIRGSEGREVFSERKGLSLFRNKTLRVRRLLDEKNQTLLYIAYSTRLSSSPDEGISSGRYRHAPKILDVYLRAAAYLSANGCCSSEQRRRQSSRFSTGALM